MMDDHDGRNVFMNRIATTLFFVGSTAFLACNHLYILMLSHALFCVTFPLCYVLWKFNASDCINKPYIVEKGLGEDTTMEFEDERRNIRTMDFVEREMMNANFWLIVASSLVSYAGLLLMPR